MPLAKTTYTLGYVPVSFPRDPIFVNLVEEHTMMGQIIEPILDADQNGNLDKGIAESWNLHDGGKKLRIRIASGRKFSNGKVVNEDDVIYSLHRHLNNRGSQSSVFLKDITGISKVDSMTIEIVLERPNPSILKALTRDQLGILPNGWQFDSSSSEPFIGTGPYRAIKMQDGWHLIANENYNGFRPAKIRGFKLIFYLDDKFTVPPEGLPDVLPNIPERAIAAVRSNPNFLKDRFQEHTSSSFTQTTFWMHPKSQLSDDKHLRLTVMRALDTAITKYGDKRSLNLATGMIPIGVQGHLTERPVLPSATTTLKELKKIKLAYMPGTFGEFVHHSETRALFLAAGIDLELVAASALNLSAIADMAPDVVTGSWAGGFNDPVGFIGLLDQLLGVPFSKHLSDYGFNLEKAAFEPEWTTRAALFRQLSTEIVKNGLMVPGWRVNSYFVSLPSIVETAHEFRFTPRFNNIKVKY